MVNKLKKTNAMTFLMDCAKTDKNFKFMNRFTNRDVLISLSCYRLKAMLSIRETRALLCVILH
jgi:hypothetical protein